MVALVRFFLAMPQWGIVRAVAASALLGSTGLALPQTRLADQPPFTVNAVPGNLAVPLSIEYPTAVSVANIADYTTARDFIGYFDPGKCYAYHYEATEANRYFYPISTTTTRTCNGAWSGSFMNWATMQTIDQFRKVLTGGLRTIDTPTVTIIQKAWASGQGGAHNFPNRTLNAGISGSTPFNWTQFNMRIQGLGYEMHFTGPGSNPDADAVDYDPSSPVDPATNYRVSVRVRVCDPNAQGGVEGNCVAYGDNYKPEGLIQRYSDRIRYSVFGYLNDFNPLRDAGVLRARQKFVGPTTPRPGLTALPNALREWDAATGVFVDNPNPGDAAATGVSNSGVINYINKAGQTSGVYKSKDPVSELYYAVIRYFKNLGNVPEWSDLSIATSAGERDAWVDGFPVITNWDDPIQYSCQRNFILGIGDIHTHNDKNVPGPTPTVGEPAKPAAVSLDRYDAVADTNRIGAMEGMGNIGDLSGFTMYDNSAYIAGLAYDAHTRDIRPDNAALPQTVGKQTITTYWVDVLEYQEYGRHNQYWLATKYGGFRVPTDYNPDTATTAPATSLWNTSGAMAPDGSELKPDNYFTSAAPADMEAGLISVFNNIVSNLSATSSAFSLSSPYIDSTGASSFSSQYDSSNWTGEVQGGTITFPAPSYQSVVTNQWNASARMEAQFLNRGWDANRRVVTWDGTRGVAFRASGGSSVTAAQLATLDTDYVDGDDRTPYLNYLRGDRSNEVGQTNALGYRARVKLLGDIVDSKVVTVSKPDMGYSDSYNPGYSAFASANAARATTVYVGANDGMLHALNGDMGTTGGTELFAYVPGSLFSGPNNTPNTDGLAALGSPDYVHHYYVNGAIKVADIDMARTGGAVTGNPAPNWRSVLIGGLGKGGRSYYAIDVTSPAAMTSEANVAARVLWEFPNANTPAADRALMGFSYGAAMVTKTQKYGWVVILPSGNNTPDGQGHLFFVNPANGNLLERVDTPAGTYANQAGLMHVQVFTRNITDNTAESLYAGDLLGNVWRVDVRGTAAYQSASNPLLLARATQADGVTTQPITSRIRVAIHPRDNQRYVMFGTGRLLAAGDIGDTQPETFYVIKDGTQSAFNTTATLPTGVTFPITKSRLVQNTDLVNGFVADATRPMGWYVELGQSSGGLGWRVTSEADTFYSEVAFSSIVPSGDSCSSGGSTRVYDIDFASGQSVLLSAADAMGVSSLIAYSSEITGLIADLRFVNRDGTAELVGGGTGLGNGTNASAGGLVTFLRKRPTGPGLRRLNWRELPSPQ